MALFIPPVLLGATLSQQDESKLADKVRGDGTLYGFAKACNMSEKDLDNLFSLQLSSTRDFVQNKAPGYTLEYFEADFKSGMENAFFFASNADTDTDSYKRNCAEIRHKVNGLLHAK